MAQPALTAHRLPGRLRSSTASTAFGSVGLLAIALYFLLPQDAQSVFFVAIGFASVTAIYVGTIRNLPRGERLPWHLFSLGLLGQVAGDAIFAVYELKLNSEPASPSIADVFYLGGYPLLAAGIFLILRRLGGQTSRVAVLDTIVVFCGVVLVQWVFFVDPYTHRSFGSEGARVVAMAYPAMDVLLLVAFAQLLVGPGGRSAAYRLLLASVALWVVADEVYGLQYTSYRGGDWIDALWLGSYVVWGAAALDPTMARIAQFDRRRLPRLSGTRLVLLAFASLTAPAILVIEHVAHHRVHAVVLGLGGGILAMLVLARLAGLLRTVEAARRSESVARREAQRAQRLLTDQNEQLVELDRLKDEFVSSVSHELRTPLTSIIGYVELLRENAQDVEAGQHLEIVDRNAQRLLGLVTDLLFTARLQEGRLTFDMREVDLGRLVAHAVESARPRADSASVVLNLERADVPPVVGEAARLAQLLDNLVSNAIKFTPAGGRVDVALSARDGLVQIEVADTGIGIPADERPRLFERFFRAQTALEHEIQGTGLGLFISKTIAEAHGGTIEVESTEGHGTTFRLEFPAAA